MKTTFIIVVLSLFLAVLGLQLRSEATGAWRKTATDDDIYYLPPNPWLKVGALGYNEALADLIWIKSIVYFSEAPKTKVHRGEFHGDQSAPKGDKLAGRMNYYLRYLRAVSYLDPMFKTVYITGAHLALYHEGVISRPTVEGSAEILRDGLKRFPDSGEMHFLLGFNLYYEMPPFVTDDAEREKLQKDGIRLIEKASLFPDAPPMAASLAEGLLEKHAMQDLIIAHLEAQLAVETNPDIRDRLIRDLTAALGEAARVDTERMQQRWRTWQKDIPWAPFDLYLLLTGSNASMERLAISDEEYLEDGASPDESR